MNASSAARWIQVLVFTTLLGGFSQGLPTPGEASVDGSSASTSLAALREQYSAQAADGVVRSVQQRRGGPSAWSVVRRSEVNEFTGFTRIDTRRKDT